MAFSPFPKIFSQNRSQLIGNSRMTFSWNIIGLFVRHYYVTLPCFPHDFSIAITRTRHFNGLKTDSPEHFLERFKGARPTNKETIILKMFL
jgi:hypothetical protein